MFTIDDLTRILVESAGEPDGIDAGTDIADVEFDSLGYDSLSLLEAGGRIEREFAVALDDAWLAEVRTPRELVGFVNNAIAG